MSFYASTNIRGLEELCFQVVCLCVHVSVRLSDSL